MDSHQLFRSLFDVKDFLIKHNTDKFASFDLTDNPNQIHGDSFKIPVDNEVDVLYYLKFYDLAEKIEEKDIIELKNSKGYFGSVYLILKL